MPFSAPPLTSTVPPPVMLCGQAACAVAVGLFWIWLSWQIGMFPPVNLTSGGMVNVVVLGDCEVAKLSNVVLMMLCSETPP